MSTVGRKWLVGGRDRSQGDVFPALGAFVTAGIVLGAAVAVVGSELVAASQRTALVSAAYGASLGAILGLFAGLGRGVWRPGRPSQEPGRTAAPASPRLWDPWVDAGRDTPWTASEGSPDPVVADDPQDCVGGDNGLIAERALVRPRVHSRETGEAIPLDDEIGPMIQAGRSRVIAIRGGPGSGKTTALRHLAALLPPWARDRIRLLDQPGDSAGLEAASTGGHLVFAALEQGEPRDALAVYHLAAWGRDDLIEYLLGAHRESCASVMARLKAPGDLAFLEGIPELWTVVLDQMVRDESTCDVRTALRSELTARLEGHTGLRELIADYCLSAVRQNKSAVIPSSIAKLPGGASASGPLALGLARLIRHHPTALLLAAERIAAVIKSGQERLALAHRLPRELVQEAAQLIASDSSALQHLSDWVSPGLCGARGPMSESVLHQIQPTAASLLHAATPAWRPDPETLPRLEGAYLTGAAWLGLSLAEIDIRNADLRESDLSKTNLTRARADRAQLSLANLQGARLAHWRAERADLGRANLRRVTADHAWFHGANLAGASLREASLWKANLREADIEGADFAGANLEDADLRGLKLRLARWDGARFGGADLWRADLEEMELREPDFHDAILCGALLTGSRMPNASFLGADLRESGLAEVHWPGVCLRDADLRGASFHLGSSRSGLVDSPIACEGSRTGFYTDDYHDQDIKPAEEIRKANLRFADLRGARIDGVDFYLVDLRGALYSHDQADHLRRSRAILEDRIA
jgi:uncharacterized protein YjbI with pentapeptide repeats